MNRNCTGAPVGTRREKAPSGRLFVRLVGAAAICSIRTPPIPWPEVSRTRLLKDTVVALAVPKKDSSVTPPPNARAVMVG